MELLGNNTPAPSWSCKLPSPFLNYCFQCCCNSTCCWRLIAISNDTCHKIFLLLVSLPNLLPCSAATLFFVVLYFFSYFNQKWKLNAANEDFNCVQQRNGIACGFCGCLGSGIIPISIKMCVSAWGEGMQHINLQLGTYMTSICCNTQWLCGQ